MKKIILIISTFVLSVGGIAFASPGGLDSNGGHYCRTNCAKYGYKTDEYHCHKSYCKLPSVKKMTIKYIS